MTRIIETGSPEHMDAFTASTDPAHLVYGFAADCELILRGEATS